MRIRCLEIERFRGIKKLAWNIGGDFVCLIGPGDSTKTTILDAIEFVLSPRWNIPFDDTDFYDAQTTDPIRIVVTVGDLPEELKSDAKYGYLARGWSAAGELHDEPSADDEVVISIELRVDSSLEPSWMVVNNRNADGKIISVKDREKLGCARLGDFLDRHFSWGRGSILARFSDELESSSAFLAGVGRAAKAALADLDQETLKPLSKTAERAHLVGAEFGVAARSCYRPHLDMQAISVGIGGMCLHDGEIPLRRAGLGTRRLLAIAMQREVAKTNGLTLIDEVEHGLEPHRIRHLLRVMRDTDGVKRHVLMTTHAPVVLGELKASELCVVRSTEGITSVLPVDSALQSIILKASEAFLARKVLICEGRTELGFCRRLDQWWTENGPSFGLSGVALADGGGTDTPCVALAFAGLGYEVALLADSDQPLKPNRTALEAAGVAVFQWNDGAAIEERIALDLPWQGVVDVVLLAMDHWGEQAVQDAVSDKMSVSSAELAGNPAEWHCRGFDESKLRCAVGKAAKTHKVGNRKGWFKRVDIAEELTDIVIRNYNAIREKDLGVKIEALRLWAHRNG